MAENKNYQVMVRGTLVPVTEDVYRVCHQTKRRAVYLEERDAQNGVVSYNAMDTDEMVGEDTIADRFQPTVEDIVMDKLMKQKLRKCLDVLDIDERKLITALYYHEKSQVQLGKDTGVKQQTISYREKKILKKLKKMLEK